MFIVRELQSLAQLQAGFGPSKGGQIGVLDVQLYILCGPNN